MDYLDSVQEAIDLIEENLEDNIELEDIAKSASMSLPHLYRMFYSLTGHPIKDYMRKRRISTASEHLRNSDSTVMDIALMSGFESQAAFSKAFKKVVGVSPKIYKRSDVFYCFERINLHEKVNYLEARDLFERYPDVKVIQMKGMKALSYIHHSDRLEDIEREAFAAVQRLIERAKENAKKVRFFGRNIETGQEDGSGYAYEVLVPVDESFHLSIGEMETRYLQGGLYAVGSTPADRDEKIISLWNRMYSEWLPKSVFAEGGHSYLEEFIPYNEKLVRMKLYLPIERHVKPEMMTIQEVVPFWVAYCKAYGPNAQEKADMTLSKWLETEDAFVANSAGQIYLSYDYGNENEAEHWSEYGISTFSKIDSIKVSNIQQKSLGGGLYAVTQTKAYGTLTGVLEIVHRWIVTGDQYFLDESRQWFAQYSTTSQSETNGITVRCYIPVLERSKFL